MSARLRRLWLDVHLWLGVGLSIPIIIICFTGAVLVFHEELEPFAHPARFAVSGAETIAPSAYLAAARRAVGEDFAVASVRFPDADGRPVTAQARAKARPPEGGRPETRTVFLDPPTARVLDVANTRAEAFGVMHVLHGSLMIPDVGRKIVGWIGWAMLISSLTGVWLWWPRNGTFLKALRWRRGPRTTFNLHHMLGFWIAIPLAILSLTGVYISFPQSARAFASNFVAMSPAQPRGPPGSGGAPLEDTHMGADAAAAAARALVPDAALAAVTLPTRGRGEDGPSWRIDLRAGEVPATQVHVDDVSGEAALREERARLPGDGLALTMRRIHDGVGQHALWRLIVFLGGVLPVILAVTGVVMWLRRRAARLAIRRGRPEPISVAREASESRS